MRQSGKDFVVVVFLRPFNGSFGLFFKAYLVVFGLFLPKREENNLKYPKHVIKKYLKKIV